MTSRPVFCLPNKVFNVWRRKFLFRTRNRIFFLQPLLLRLHPQSIGSPEYSGSVCSALSMCMDSIRVYFIITSFLEWSNFFFILNSQKVFWLFYQNCRSFAFVKVVVVPVDVVKKLAVVRVGCFFPALFTCFLMLLSLFHCYLSFFFNLSALVKGLFQCFCKYKDYMGFVIFFPSWNKFVCVCVLS